MSEVMRGLPSEYGTLYTDNLDTLRNICHMMEQTKPEPGSSMARQIQSSRGFIARVRSGLSNGHMTNFEISDIHILTQVAYQIVHGPESDKYRSQYAGYGLTKTNVMHLWLSVSELMCLFKKHGPDGEIGPN